MMRMVGVTTRNLGNGEVRISITDDPKLVKAMRVKRDSHFAGVPAHEVDEDGCITCGIATGIEVDVAGQKTRIHFGQPKR